MKEKKVDSEYIKEKTSYVFAPSDPDLFLNDMQSFINLSSTTKHQLGEKTRLRIKSNFSIKKNISS